MASKTVTGLFETVGFWLGGGREMGKPEGEKPLGAIKEENQQQTKSTYGVDGRWRPINFQRTQIHFFSDVLTAVVVVFA